MVLRQEGQGEMVACAENDMVDVTELAAGFQRQGERDGRCGGQRLYGWGLGDGERDDFVDADCVGGEKGAGEVKVAVAVGLVDCRCVGTEFSRDVGCGDGAAD